MQLKIRFGILGGALFLTTFFLLRSSLSHEGEGATPKVGPGLEHELNLLEVLNEIGNANISVKPSESTVLFEPNPCQNRGAGVHLLFMVTSAPENGEKRAVIRKTLQEIEQGLQQKMDREGVKRKYTKLMEVYFFLGQDPNHGVSDEVKAEWSQHKDLIVDDMMESYLHLTVKTLRMIKWVLHNCNEASYIVKVDDDVFLNVPTLLNYLESRGSQMLIMGHVYWKGNIDRDSSSKWYTPLSIWPDEHFPMFVGGFCYILGMEAAAKIFEASQYVPLIHLEDVYLTGILASDKLQIPLTDMGKGDVVVFLQWFHYSYPISWWNERVIIHGVTPAQYRCCMKNTLLKREDNWLEWKWPVFFYYCP